MAIVLGVGLLTGTRLSVLNPSPRPVQAAPPVMAVTPDGGARVSPNTPIVVRAERGTVRSVTVTNTTNGSPVAGTLSPDGTTWTSSEPLAYSTSYAVAASATGPGGTVVQQNAKVTTLTPSAQAYPALTPAPNTSPTFGVGQIIAVSFDRDITDKAAAERALAVQSDPPQPGSWYWIDKRTAHYRPPHYWQPGTTITVRADVYGVHLGRGVYGKTNRVATYKVGDSWVAKADGASKKMQIFHNGTLVKTMPISLGSPRFPSHTGPHVVSDKQPSVIMDSCTFGLCPGDPGYYRQKVDLAVRISNGGEFVHSAPWSVAQQGRRNVSHGCVNLAPANAQWFYDHFNLGDVVEISNSGGPPMPVWDTYGDWVLPWNEWTAGSALRE